ncbi:hypothetical protein [Loktanella sp. Alg231-35]|uniref:hypothetical protein n=1 Tax=Loktanella sp. Alg231-35 TaxID=1922220 RepID=UPI000D54D9F9|nr:hypothetical protein [Loktanella sp. Alg231-35]
MLNKLLLVTALLVFLPAAVTAQCRIAVAGTACVAVPKPLVPEPDPVAIGQTLERGKYSMLMNARYYGLPTVSEGWVYMRIEEEIYRVDWRSHEVLEKVTHLASRNW